MRFTIDVVQVYKHGVGGRLSRGLQSLRVPLEDLSCKCPKLRVKSSYLILGNDDRRAAGVKGLIADRDSIVVDWKDEWARRMRRYQRRDRNGKCAKMY